MLAFKKYRSVEVPAAQQHRMSAGFLFYSIITIASSHLQYIITKLYVFNVCEPYILHHNA